MKPASTNLLGPHHRVYASFAIHAFSMGNIFPRLPDIQREMDVGEGALGLALMGAPLGTLLALTFAATLVERIGLRRSLQVSIPLLAAAYAVAVHAPGPVSLFALLVPVGWAIGCVELIINLEADRTEHLIGRRIMNRAHAFWSIGFFGAGLFGSALAQAGFSPQAHMALVFPIALAGTVVLLGGYEPAPPRVGTTAAGTGSLALPTVAILSLVAVTLPAMILEGASMDWSAIYMRRLFESDPLVSGLAVAAFASSQAATRFFADGLIERHSAVHVVRWMLGLLGAGILVVCASGQPSLSLAGFAMLGVGTGTIFPICMSAAAQRSDRSAALNVAALAQTSFVAFLVGPPLLGMVGEHVGLRWIFGAGAPLVVFGFLFTRALGKARVGPA